MIDPTTYAAATTLLVTSINPIVIGVWFAQVVADHREKAPDCRLFLLASIFSIFVTQYANHIFRESGFWRSQPGFPSGHVTFAASAITSMAIRDRRWLWILAPFAMVLGIALILRHMHSPLDVIGAVLLTPPATALCHWVVSYKPPDKL